MPLFEIDDEERLRAFRQLRGGGEIYEREIEDLLWNGLEEIIGEPLFRVARQPSIHGGGRPDIVALAAEGRIVVIEVKRDVDRGQLAQCLEYAGWARTSGLDELAGLYYASPDQFFRDWQEFTNTPTPQRIQRSPRLVLVAREFHGRTGSAFEYLVENDLPVKLVRVSIYEASDGRRFLDVEGEHEPEIPVLVAKEPEVADHTKVDGRRVRMDDLVDAGLLRPGQTLVWKRPTLGIEYRSTVTENAELEINGQEGSAWSAPSSAAVAAAGGGSFDGWRVWRTEGGELIDDLRRKLAESRSDS
jgi:Restriction Enzyme Adenine Methylase Associated